MSESIYVTGSKGLVGSGFIELLSDKYSLITPEIDELDITDEQALEKYFRDINLGVIVNFAALTDVDGAEKEKDDKNGSFWQVNVVGAANLAGLAKKKGAQMIQISTDFVFPGCQKFPGPYSEDVPPPDKQEGIGWYGWTKRMAEKEVRKVILPAIVRISFPFGDRTSPKDYLNKIKSGVEKGYPMFSDQEVTPTFMPDLFMALEKIFKKRMIGVFHVATSPVTTPYEIGRLLVDKLRLKVEVKSGSITDFLKKPGIAPRPIKGGLNCEETQRKLGIKFLFWQEGLDAWL